MYVLHYHPRILNPFEPYDMRRKSFQIKNKSLALYRTTVYSHNWKSIGYRDVQNILTGRIFENFEMEKANLYSFKSFQIF